MRIRAFEFSFRHSWAIVGLILVACADGGGEGSSPNTSSAETQSNPTPGISSLSPSSAVAGADAQTLTVNGSGFITGSAVTYNGAAQTATYVSASELTIQLSAADQVTAGSYPVAVTNPAPGGGASTSVDFTVTVPAASLALLVGGVFHGVERLTPYKVLNSAELFDSNSGTFTSVGTMTAARFLPAAVALPKGANVLVAGGSSSTGNGTALNSAELYDVSQQTFTEIGNMNCEFQGDIMAALSNDEILIFGGVVNETGKSNCAEIYNPGTGSFSLTGSLPTQSVDGAAMAYAVLKNGQVLVVGGASPEGYVNTAQLYDPSTGMFTPTGNMTTSRGYATATLLKNGMVLVTGGQADCCMSVNTAELYDPNTGTFASTNGPMSAARSFHTATLLPNGSVLIAGGIESPTSPGNVASAELYNSLTGTFSLTGSMSVGRAWHTAILLTDGLVLVAGGATYGQWGSATNSADLYNPSTGTFAPTGTLTTARFAAAAVSIQ